MWLAAVEITSPILKSSVESSDKVSVCFAHVSVERSTFLTSDSYASEKNFAMYFFSVFTSTCVSAAICYFL